jgi:hypothetical protein
MGDVIKFEKPISKKSRAEQGKESRSILEVYEEESGRVFQEILNHRREERAGSAGAITEGRAPLERMVEDLHNQELDLLERPHQE